MSEERQKILQKVRALLNKTTARGCTEAEALAAAEVAARLMAAHGIDADGVDIEDATADVETGTKSMRARLWGDIAHATNTSVILTPSGIKFYGLQPGPEIASYLCQVCDRAIDREIRWFKKTEWYRRRRTVKAKRKAVADFTAGLVTRLIQKIDSLFADQHSEAAIIKAQAARDSANPDAKIAKMRQAPGTYADAARAGWMAGQKVQLRHGMGGDAAPAQIGGK